MLEAKLTDREQRTLDHLRRAEEQQMGLAEYARGAGVSASELYSGKQSLVRKGVIPGNRVVMDACSAANK
jgi:DNA-binding phage protein